MSEREKDILAWAIVFLIGSAVVGAMLYAAPVFFIGLVGIVLAIFALTWSIDRIMG